MISQLKLIVNFCGPST